MGREREIVVRGTGETRALPDQATIRLEISADHKTQEGAYEMGASLARRVDAVLGEHRNAIGRSTVARLLVQPRTRWHRGEDIRTGWRARRISFIEIIVLDALAETMASLVEAGAAVHGPDWQLNPANPAHDEARRAAADDAKRRAASYAAALGLKLGPIAWIAEPGTGSVVHRAAPVPEIAALRAGAPAEPETIDITPSEMSIFAEIEVGFHIDSGDPTEPTGREETRTRASTTSGGSAGDDVTLFDDASTPMADGDTAWPVWSRESRD